MKSGKARRYTVTLLLFAILGISIMIPAYACSANYTMTMQYSVNGKYAHTLEADKKVRVTGCGYTTSYYAGSVPSRNLEYNVTIQRRGSVLTWGCGRRTADWENWYFDFAANRVLAGTYRIMGSVYNSSSSLVAHVDGKIKQ